MTLLAKKYIALIFIIVKNLKTCTAVLLNVGNIMAKAQRLNGIMVFIASQNKAVNLAGYIVTS